MNRQRLAIATVVLLAAIVAGALLWPRLHPSPQLQEATQAPTVGKAALGKTAPQFSVLTTSGLFDLQKQTKPVFLELFASWCPHCQRETADINKLYDAYHSRVAFVAVSASDTGMDGTSPESENDVYDFTRRFQTRYPVAFDGLLYVSSLYLQGAYPTIVVIDRNKKITYLNTGEVSYSDLAAQLEKVLK
ncbi:MAG: TlpA family protein disulfide reductase [Vulcanimicrobiaceae bacterium]